MAYADIFTNHKGAAMLQESPSNTSTEAQENSRTINWKQIVKEWQGSNLSQKAFCKSRHLNFNSFAYQSSKLKNKGCKGGAIVPIKISSDHYKNTRPSQSLSIILPTGIKLLVPQCYDYKTLSHLINALRA